MLYTSPSGHFGVPLSYMTPTRLAAHGTVYVVLKKRRDGSEVDCKLVVAAARASGRRAEAVAGIFAERSFRVPPRSPNMDTDPKRAGSLCSYEAKIQQRSLSISHALTSSARAAPLARRLRRCSRARTGSGSGGLLGWRLSPC